MKRFGPNVASPPTKEIPGPGWKMSAKTLKEIQDMEDQNAANIAILAYCWHYYI